MANFDFAQTCVVFILTSVLILIFLYDVSKYKPIIRQPKPKVRSSGERHSYSHFITDVSFF